MPHDSTTSRLARSNASAETGNHSSLFDRGVPLPPAGVVFDMDGVLVDTRLYHLRAFQELGAAHGIEMTPDTFQTMFGLANPVFLPRMFGRAMTDEEVRVLADWKEARYRELIANEIALSPGVLELVAWLAGQGCPMAVASSAPRANVEQILQGTGIRESFAQVLAAEDVRRHKPDPEMFLLAAHRLGVEPAECWVIEDSLHGLEAGRSAGIPCLAVATTHAARGLSIANAVFSDMLDLFQQVRDALDARRAIPPAH